MLQASGIDMSGMRPMGSAEAKMRIFARRTKRGGYSWSESGARAMLSTIMRHLERQVVRMEASEGKKPAKRTVNVRKLVRDAVRQSKGCIDGMIRLLQGQDKAIWWKSTYKGGILFRFAIKNPKK